MKVSKNLLNDVLEQVFAGTLASMPCSNWILLLHLLSHQAVHQVDHLGVNQGKDKDGKNLYRIIVGNDDAGHAFIIVQVIRVEKGPNCTVYLWVLLANPPLENKNGL